MTEIRFHGTDRTEAFLLRSPPERFAQRGNLDRISRGCRGPMGFDISHRARINAGHRLSPRDYVRLTVDTRRGVTRLRSAVVIDRPTLNDRVDEIAVSQGVDQPFQDYHANSIAKDDSLSIAVEDPTVPVWRIDTSGFIIRSEEHTSELQSQSNLVCRLLLEKKKQ